MIVVIGVGNDFRRDDAAGLEVARRVRAAAPTGVRVLEHDGEPAGLLDVWDGADVAYVIDAVRGTGGPGAVHRVEVGSDSRLNREPRDSTHALSFGEAVALGRVLDRLPGRLVLVGVEGGDFAAGQGLGPEVAAAVGAVADEIVREVGG
ncbi:MAG TPA: hydrogenase maturation protease [Jiangellaceae bacterium]